MRNGMLRPATLAAAVGLSAAVAAAQVPPPSLAGQWTLNPKLSDDVKAKALEAVGGGKSVGQAQEEVERLALRDVILGILPALGTLDIEQSPSEVKLIDADDNVRIFYFGREHVREGRLGRKLRCTSEWKSDQLVVTEIGESSKLTEVLTAVPSRKQILHAVRLEDDRLKAPLEFRLAYDAAVPPPPTPKD